MVTFLTVVLALFDISTNKSGVDNWGHLGGFFTGFPFSMAIVNILKTSMRRHQMPGWTYEKYCKAFGAFATFAWFALGLSLFFTQRKTYSICEEIDKVIE